MVEYSKSKSTQPSCQTTSPTLYLVLTYLQYFVAAAAHHVQSDDLLLRPRADELHERLLLSLRQRVVQRSELGGIDFERLPPELGHRLALGHSDGADGRVGEHHRRDVLVIGQRRRLGIEEAVCQLPARVDRHRSQFELAGNVAESVDTLLGRVLR